MIESCSLQDPGASVQSAFASPKPNGMQDLKEQE